MQIRYSHGPRSENDHQLQQWRRNLRNAFSLQPQTAYPKEKEKLIVKN